MEHTSYSQVMPGVYKITPCTCNQCMQERQAQEQQFINFLKRLNADYERAFGKSARSYEIGKAIYGEQFESGVYSS